MRSTPRYLSFVRALAMGSTLLGAGCADDAGDDKPDAAVDAAIAEVAGPDTGNAEVATEVGQADKPPEVADMQLLDVVDMQTPPVVFDGPLPPPNLPSRA